MWKHLLDCSDLESSSKRQRQEDELLRKEQVAARQSSENQVHDEEFLCDECRAVDWHSLPTLASDGLLEDKNMTLRFVDATVEELKNSSCRICAILSTIKDHSLDGRRCVLKAFPLSRHFTHHGPALSRTFRFKFSAPDSASRCPVLDITEEKDRRQNCFSLRSLAVVRLDDFEFRTIAPDSIDYSKLKDLVKTCQEEHKRCCAAESRPNVLGLEVIDTQIQEVIKAPEQCKYLALSYVWGKQSGDSSVRDIQNSPPVIKDAISVTNSMGYRYLWVDRYCISDPQERHRIISQMDQIYANASITIIAAADGDIEMGLCGVSKSRQLQRRAHIQDTAILELPIGHKDLTSSNWASRAWTYQEGYLSTRRLIFTNTQILFLCNEMYAAESWQQLLKAKCYSDMADEFKHLIPKFTISKHDLSVDYLIIHAEEYSKRELTRSSDSLNAFIGVLSYYARNSANSTSPVLQLPWGLIARKHAKKNTFSLRFFWLHQRPATRRSDLPSWSWTGWGGPLKFMEQDIVLQPGQMVKEGPISYLDWEISMRDEVLGVVKMYDLAWKEFEARRLKYHLHQPGPKTLQISCMVIPVSFQDIKLTEDQKKGKTEVLIHDTGEVVSIGRNFFLGVHLTLQVWEGVFLGRRKADLKLDQQVEQQDCILGLIFANRNEKFDKNWYRCLLVRQVGEGLHERVGLLYMLDLDMDPNFLCQMVYLDAVGNILDNFTISDRQRKHPFADTAESRTICLV